MTPARRLALAIPLMMTPRRGMGAVQAPYLTRPAPDGNPGVEIVDPMLVRRGMGALLAQPGPGDVGTQIVDQNGNLVYSAQQVANNPSLLSQLDSSACPPGMVPSFFPGGESACQNIAQEEAGGGFFSGPQFNYPVGGQCMAGTWCFTGTNPADPNSYTWTGGGTPDAINPAFAFEAQPLGSQFAPNSAPAPGTSTGYLNGVPLPANWQSLTPSQQQTYLNTGVLPSSVSPPGPPADPMIAIDVPAGGPGGGAVSPILSPVQPQGLVIPAPAVVTPPPSGGAPAVSSPATSGAGASILGTLSNPVNVFGVQVPVWGLGAAALLSLWLMFSSGGSRR